MTNTKAYLGTTQFRLKNKDLDINVSFPDAVIKSYGLYSEYQFSYFTLYNMLVEAQNNKIQNITVMSNMRIIDEMLKNVDCLSEWAREFSTFIRNYLYNFKEVEFIKVSPEMIESFLKEVEYA